MHETLSDIYFCASFASSFLWCNKTKSAGHASHLPQQVIIVSSSANLAPGKLVGPWPE
jgi:hypothetical protein